MTTDIAVPAGSFMERLAKYAQQSAAVVVGDASGSGFVGTRAGVLTLEGKQLPDNKLDCIVVDFVRENHYYDVPFDPNNPRSPVCYAFGDSPADMEPHSEAEKPQAANCASCPKNKFPAKQANGKQPPKECKNVYRLAVIPSSPLTAEAIAEAKPAFLRVPVMSGANWAAYVQMLQGRNPPLPPFAALTQIGTVPDPKAQFKLTFTNIGMVPNEETFNALALKHDSMFDAIQLPYRKNEEPQEG